VTRFGAPFFTAVSVSKNSFLAARGARLENDLVRDFGDPAGELAATTSAGVLAELSQFGVLAFTGDDARAFLNGQLSCDVANLANDAGAYGAYCSAKGRVLANFLLWREALEFRMLLARSLVLPVRDRLQKYVLRAKVAIQERTDEVVVLGAAGRPAADEVAGWIGRLAPSPLAIDRRNGFAAIAVPAGRFLLTARTESAQAAWDRLSRALRPVGAACWDWLEIANGVPWITVATQDRFVPQMVNLELLGGVSFQKGCYPGQEIVARTQHLGKLKRRLHLANVGADTMSAPGEELFSDDLGAQSVGTVVNAAPAPAGGFDILAVVQTASAATAKVRLGSPSGYELHFRPLPYTVP